MVQRLQSLALRAAAFVACSAPYQALAQLDPNPPDVTGKETGDLKTTIVDVTKAVLNFMTLIAVVIIVVAGIRFIISQGEEQEKEKARKTIVYAIIGLVVIILARAIVTFVVDII
ncbi:MAG: pilin [Candidatus Peribacteraceae bacterium]|nr:pilin [Candidatus Peribacteraceae bacterium]